MTQPTAASDNAATAVTLKDNTTVPWTARPDCSYVLDTLSFSIFTDTNSPCHTLPSWRSTHLVGVVLVVTWAIVSDAHTREAQHLLTQVEVVVLCVTDDDEATDEVGES